MSYLRAVEFNQAQHLYGRMYFRYTGVPAPGGSRIVDVVGGYDNGDVNSHSITVSSTGKVIMKAGGLVGPDDEFIGTKTLAADTWYRFEWHATTGADSTGTFELRVYEGTATGVPFETSGLYQLVPTGTEFEDIDFGPRLQTITAWIDAVELSNTDWVGP